MSRHHLFGVGLELLVLQNCRQQSSDCAVLRRFDFSPPAALLALFARFWGGHSFPNRLTEWRHVTHRRILHGVRQQRPEHLGHSLHTDQSVGAAQRNSGVLDRGLGVFGRRGHPLTRWAVLGMLIGFAGAALMLIPKGSFHASNLLAQFGALTACCAWAIGTMYYRSIDTELEFPHVHGHANVHGRTDAADGGRRSRRSRALAPQRSRARGARAISPSSAPAWPIPPMAGSASMRRRR